ncbi:MAG: sodium-dependent transporter [Halobacteriota archaeon]
MDRWSSRAGFLLAAVGAAVGLGNIWRFSAVVGQNGGGAYLVPYLLAAFGLAVPLLILELAVGRDLRVDVVAAFRSARPRFAVLGWVVTGSVVLILSYYLVLTGWVLSFFVGTLLDLGLTFGTYTGSGWPIVAFVLTTVATGAIVSLGVREGIERTAKVVIPVVFLLLVVLAAYATTLEGFGRATTFLFEPDVAVLGDPLLWSAAFGQVFFSLSVGQGIMLTFGSYLGEETNLSRSALTITLLDILVAILAGLVIFPVVFTVGLEPTLGTELAFSTLPAAFEAMRFGTAIAVAFFGLLFLAALTSAIALLEVAVAAATRSTGRSRQRVSAWLTGLVLLLGLPSALSYSAVGLTVGGVPVLDLMDESVGAYALPITATLIAVVFVWFQNGEAIRRQLPARPLRLLVGVVIPTVLIGVTALRLSGLVGRPWQYTGSEVADLAPAWRLALLVAIGLGLVVVAHRLVSHLPNNR